MSDLFPADDTLTLERLRTRLADDAAREGLLDVAYRQVDSPVGPLLLAATERGLVRVAFAFEDHDRVLADLAARVGPRVLRAPARLEAAAPLKIPAAIFQAERDGIVRASNADFLAGLFPGCEVSMVQGTEHALSVEIPELIDAAVERLTSQLHLQMGGTAR